MDPRTNKLTLVKLGDLSGETGRSTKLCRHSINTIGAYLPRYLIAEISMFLRLYATAVRADLLSKNNSLAVVFFLNLQIERMLKVKLVLVPPGGCLLRPNYKFSGQCICKSLRKNEQRFCKVNFEFTFAITIYAPQ